MSKSNESSRSELLSILGILLAALPTVWACSCAPPPPPDQALKAAVGVFLGKVVAVEVNQAKFEKTVTIDVERWWKGGDAAQVKVVTPSDGAACGVDFKKGDRFIVYAHVGEKNQLWGVSLCSRTAIATQPYLAQEMKALGEGTAPKKTP